MNFVIEPNIEDISWFKGITGRLSYFASRKRYTTERFSDADFLSVSNENEPVIIIGATYTWLKEQVKKVRALGSHPILVSNQPSGAFKGDYSYVSVDLRATVEDVLTVFKECNKTKTALFGVNPSSLADIGRAEAFTKNCSAKDMFFNLQDLETAAKEFIAVMDSYDSVICVNSFAAATLLMQLKLAGKREDDLLVASQNYSEILSVYNNIIAVCYNFEEHLEAASNIYKFIKQNSYLSGMRATVKHSLILPKGLSKAYHTKAEQDGNLEENNRFFSDEFLKSLSKSELLLKKCDDIDRQIIGLLIKNHKYSFIAEKCFISEYTVKYRIKSMMEICGISSKGEFVEFLNKYM